MNINQIIVDDDVIPHELQEEIKRMHLADNFPWYLSFEQTQTANKLYGNYFSLITPNISEYSQFVHVFQLENEINSSPIIMNPVLTIFDMCKEKYGFNDNISRIKSNFCTRVHVDNPDAHQIPHTDSIKDHWVMLYYAVDSDGDTFIFNEKLHEDEPIWNVKNLSIKQRISPKQGRVVIFDGSHLHAGMHPRNHYNRVVINFVFAK
jgi:hypothetical protein